MVVMQPKCTVEGADTVYAIKLLIVPAEKPNVPCQVLHIDYESLGNPATAERWRSR